jgi:hypothetical protein
LYAIFTNKASNFEKTKGLLDLVGVTIEGFLSGDLGQTMGMIDRLHAKLYGLPSLPYAFAFSDTTRV